VSGSAADRRLDQRGLATAAEHAAQGDQSEYARQTSDLPFDTQATTGHEHRAAGRIVPMAANPAPTVGATRRPHRRVQVVTAYYTVVRPPTTSTSRWSSARRGIGVPASTRRSTRPTSGHHASDRRVPRFAGDHRPLFIGRDPTRCSEPAWASALRCSRPTTCVDDRRRGPVHTHPAVSHAILSFTAVVAWQYFLLACG